MAPWSHITEKNGYGHIDLDFACPSCQTWFQPAITVLRTQSLPYGIEVYNRERNESCGGTEEPWSLFPPEICFLTRCLEHAPAPPRGCWWRHLPKWWVALWYAWGVGPHFQGEMSSLSYSGSHLWWSWLSHVTLCQMSPWCLPPPA